MYVSKNEACTLEDDIRTTIDSTPYGQLPAPSPSCDTYIISPTLASEHDRTYAEDKEREA